MPPPGTGGPGNGQAGRHHPAAPEPGRESLILYLRRADRERLRVLAEQAWPEEACGLLPGWPVADGAVVGGVVASANIAEGRDRFEVDPGVRARLQRDLRDADDGRTLVGHFHSHPTGAAAPSAVDAARAGDEPALVWVIVPVTQAGAGALAAWRFAPEAGGFRPVALETPLRDPPVIG